MIGASSEGQWPRGTGVAMAKQHEHEYHFTREPDVLAMTAKALDWPDYVPEKIVAVQLCTCGELHDIEWMAVDSRGSIPGWMARRYRDYFDREAQSEGK
jgi:hypothetical protein